MILQKKYGRLKTADSVAPWRPARNRGEGNPSDASIELNLHPGYTPFSQMRGPASDITRRALCAAFLERDLWRREIINSSDLKNIYVY